MLLVFLRDLVGPRRLISSALVIGVAAVVAQAIELTISPRIYLAAAVASAIVTTALLLSSYYRVEHLRQYVHLPGATGSFLIQLTAAILLLVLLESVAAAVVFGLIRHDLNGPSVGLMAGYALIGVCGVMLAVVQRRTWIGPFGAVVTAGTAAAALTIDSSTVLALAGAVALALLAIGLARSTGTPFSPTGRPAPDEARLPTTSSPSSHINALYSSTASPSWRSP